MSPDTDPGQQVPEDLPHHTAGRQAGRHHEGEPFRDSEIEPDTNLHDAFEKVHPPSTGEDADDDGRGRDDGDEDDRDGAADHA
jgi:hypothetical protein